VTSKTRRDAQDYHHSTLCAFCSNFAPLREGFFLAKAQRRKRKAQRFWQPDSCKFELLHPTERAAG
jgi:hypothetical protein